MFDRKRLLTSTHLCILLAECGLRTSIATPGDRSTSNTPPSYYHTTHFIRTTHLKALYAEQAEVLVPCLLWFAEVFFQMYLHLLSAVKGGSNIPKLNPHNSVLLLRSLTKLANTSLLSNWYSDTHLHSRSSCSRKDRMIGTSSLLTSW